MSHYESTVGHTELNLRNFKSNLTAVVEKVKALGYAVSATKLTANSYGVPQRRCRYYIVAVRNAFAEPAEVVVQKIATLLPKLVCTDAEGKLTPNVTWIGSVQQFSRNFQHLESLSL